jgi:hypothetical protein
MKRPQTRKPRRQNHCVLGGDGGESTQTYETLSEYESENVTNSPPGLSDFGAKIKSAMQSPAEFKMYEILV